FRMTRDTKLYVGNLPPDTREKDVDDLFAKYGKISFIDLKNRRGPPFAFVEYDDPRDAEDAVRGRDGYDMDGYRLRVEFPRGQGPRGPGGRPMYGGDIGGSGGRGGGNDRFETERGGYGAGYGALGRPRGGGKRTSHRVIVTGLPPTGSWQDLKDHMREAGDVCYTDVYKDGTGVVEFARSNDVKYAVRKLDDTKFRSHEGETSYIRVKEDSSGHRDRSRSPRRSPHRSRSHSPQRRDRSRSPKYFSPRRSSRSRSPSRSRSRSRS
ncbi:hypothetical protein PENTCL1PPCAC_11520, partial [Pristionchus entomophagus]